MSKDIKRYEELPHGVTLQEVRSHIVDFVYNSDKLMNIADDLAKCTNDDERKAIFKLVLAGLDAAVSNKIISDAGFDSRLITIVRMDDSPNDSVKTNDLMTVKEQQKIKEMREQRSYDLIKDVIVDLAGSGGNGEGEIKIYEDNELQNGKKEKTGYGLAVRLVAAISASTMEEKLNLIDVQLGICSPERMVQYLRIKAYHVWSKRHAKSPQRIEELEHCMNSLDELLCELIEMDTEVGYLDQVFEILSEDRHLSARGQTNTSYIEQAIRLLEKEGFESAEIVLASKWLDDDDDIYGVSESHIDVDYFNGEEDTDE